MMLLMTSKKIDPHLEKELYEINISVLQEKLKSVNTFLEPGKAEMIVEELEHLYKHFMQKFASYPTKFIYQSQLNFLPDDQITQTVDK